MPAYQAIYPRGLLCISLHNKSVCGSMAVIIMALVFPTCSGLRVAVIVGDKCRVMWPVDDVHGEDVKALCCIAEPHRNPGKIRFYGRCRWFGASSWSRDRHPPIEPTPRKPPFGIAPSPRPRLHAETLATGPECPAPSRSRCRHPPLPACPAPPHAPAVSVARWTTRTPKFTTR